MDRLFFWIRATPFFLRLTWLTRLLLAAGFIPTGMVKFLGKRFTLISPENPIGAFFEALYQTGMYWQFIGLCQIVAGILLLIPRAHHLGALLFVPIMTNIFVITVSLGFKGTWVVTALMLLAVLYLCFWDYDRFRPLFTRSPLDELPVRSLDVLEKVGFTLFGVSILSFFLTTRGLHSTAWVPVWLAIGMGSAIGTLIRFVWVGRRRLH